MENLYSLRTRLWAATALVPRGKRIDKNRENMTPSNITLRHDRSAMSPGKHFHFPSAFLFRTLGRILFNYLNHEIAITWIYHLRLCLTPQCPQLHTVNMYPFGFVKIIVNALGAYRRLILTRHTVSDRLQVMRPELRVD
jgi:hypothetical protein